ncbi:MAG: transposase [Janthinobacterium lividum]
MLGIDDWAWRKGYRYGTILCDLETRKVVDLLPDRDAKHRGSLASAASRNRDHQP